MCTLLEAARSKAVDEARSNDDVDTFENVGGTVACLEYALKERTCAKQAPDRLPSDCEAFP